MAWVWSGIAMSALGFGDAGRRGLVAGGDIGEGYRALKGKPDWFGVPSLLDEARWRGTLASSTLRVESPAG